MRLYQTLSEADKTHLTKWFRYELKGEGGEKTTKLWQLYTLMTKPVSDKEIIWKKLYGTDNYDNRRLRNE